MAKESNRAMRTTERPLYSLVRQFYLPRLESAGASMPPLLKNKTKLKSPKYHSSY